MESKAFCLKWKQGGNSVQQFLKSVSGDARITRVLGL